ncbi:MAG: glycosyltransferase family 4 protein [Kiritimatiellae bacterium]|nr:glycosyltransferase family 4 protein [Kiritimatiellia bacterium]
MKLLYITRKFPPAVGGMERMNACLVEALRPLADLHLVAWGRSQRGLPLFAVTAAARGIARLARRSARPDLICLGDAALSPLGVALGRAGRVPVAAIAHGLDVTFSRYGYPALVLPALRRCDRVICVSRYTASLCEARGVPSDRLRVIPNGIPPPLPVPPRNAAREALRRKGWPIPGDEPLLVTVGRLVPRKGVAEFIRAGWPVLRSRFPEVHYAVIGRGPDEAAIRAAIADAGAAENVFMPGGVDDETVRLAYAAADLFLMPNRPVPDNPEGFGIVAMEASSYGLPVVATAVEGLTDAVQDGVNGRSVPPGDPAAFAQAAGDLLADPAARPSLGCRAREHALTHTWDRIAPRYLAVFEETVTRASRP